MRFTGIDEYTIQWVATEWTPFGIWMVVLLVGGMHVALALAIVTSAVWKRPARRWTALSLTATAVATTVFAGFMYADQDATRDEVPRTGSYLVVEGTPVWSEVIRDEDVPSNNAIRFRLEGSEEWLLSFPGSDIDTLIGRTDRLRVQCTPDGDSKMSCSPNITGPRDAQGSDESTWSEPVITPFTSNE